MARILLVDDNITTLKRWEMLLYPLGYEVLSFTGAEAALQILTVHLCDLLVLDLAMPVHSGYDLMQTLRKIGTEIPILVVSGKTQSKDISKALELGATDYLIKPFDDEIFVAKVEKLIKKEVVSSISTEEITPYLERFAEEHFIAPTTFLSLHIPDLAISEMGFSFQSNIQFVRGITIEMKSPCFMEMGINETRFKITTVSKNPENSEFKFTVFVSFIGLDLGTIQSVRLWVRKQFLSRKVS